MRKTYIDIGEDNTKMCVREIGQKGVNCISVSQVRDKRQAVVSTVVNFRKFACTQSNHSIIL